MSYPGNRRKNQQPQPLPQAPPQKQSSIILGSQVTKFDEMATKAFPAVFNMISGCHDAQTSADVSNLNSQFS